MRPRHFEHIYLFHGRGGRPTGSVLLLEDLLRPTSPSSNFTRPTLLHGDPSVATEDSYEILGNLDIPQGAAIIGISLGGLVAAKLQETSRPDLHVVCISSPTWADNVSLSRRMPNRLALYSSQDAIIEGRTTQWPCLAQAYDLPWLSHDTDVHRFRLSKIIATHFDQADLLQQIVAVEEEMCRGGDEL